jgi:hypothetical protein
VAAWLLLNVLIRDNGANVNTVSGLPSVSEEVSGVLVMNIGTGSKEQSRW